VCALRFREATRKDEATLFPMMRALAEQEPGAIHFEESSMGVNAIHLEVDHGNDPAIELYRRAGYEDHDRFVMTKWLTRF